MGTHWTRGPTIGRGSTASVSLATTTAGTGASDIFAVKSADLSSPSSSLLQREKYILSQLSSPYVVTCLGSDTTVEDGGRVCYNLFMEYVPGGTLSDQIRARGGKLGEDTMSSYTRQILLGLQHIHGKGFAHCDVKAQNVLVAGDGSRLKIADFGCAKEVGSDTSAFSGTPAYMAPEVARGEEQSFAADIWALGCLVIEMGTGCSNPWPDAKDPVATLYRIARSNDVPEIPGWFSEKAKDFTKKCLVRDVKERWNADRLLHHPFITGQGDDDRDDDVVEIYFKKSPTSVVDWRCWDDLEVSAGFSSDSECLVDRIRGLVSPDCLDWSAEEGGDWLIVRDGQDQEFLLRVEDDDHDHGHDGDGDDDDDEEIDRSFVWIGDDLSDYYDYYGSEISSGNEIIVILDIIGSVKDDCVIKIVDSDFDDEDDNVNGLIVTSLTAWIILLFSWLILCPKFIIKYTDNGFNAYKLLKVYNEMELDALVDSCVRLCGVNSDTSYRYSVN